MLCCYISIHLAFTRLNDMSNVSREQKLAWPCQKAKHTYRVISVRCHNLSHFTNTHTLHPAGLDVHGCLNAPCSCCNTFFGWLKHPNNFAWACKLAFPLHFSGTSASTAAGRHQPGVFTPRALTVCCRGGFLYFFVNLISRKLVNLFVLLS